MTFRSNIISIHQLNFQILFSVKWPISKKYWLGSFFRSNNIFRSNDLSGKWRSVKWRSVKCCFGQKTFGQFFSVN
jgi:hypothetical protein